MTPLSAMQQIFKRRQVPELPQPRADYDIATRGPHRRPRRGVGGVGTSGDYHFRNESSWLYTIEYARDLDRNDCVAGMCIDRLIDAVLQDTGMRPDPDTGDENADQRLKQYWKDFAEDEDLCDSAGEMTFAEMERAVLRATLVDGDIMAIATDTGAIELMEAHRCRTPRDGKNVSLGIEFDRQRRRQRYNFTREDMGIAQSLRKNAEMAVVDARDSLGHRQVFHVFNPDRTSQTRGISVFRRTADMLGMHDDIQFANLVRQQIASCFAVIRSKKTPGPLSGAQYGEQTTTSTSTHSRTTENISPGMEISSEPGESIEGFSPNIPNPQFFEHAQLILKIVAANLGLPLHAVLLDASQTNFSGWRGAHDQAKNGYKRIQRWLVGRFHRRVYQWKVRQWLQTDSELRTWSEQSDVRILRHRWQRPSWAYIQPLQDAAAHIAQTRGGLTTMRQVHAEQGKDFDEVTREATRDNAAWYRLARDVARQINAEATEDSERVSWREMLALPLHEGLTLSMALNTPDGNTTEEGTE